MLLNSLLWTGLALAGARLAGLDGDIETTGASPADYDGDWQVWLRPWARINEGDVKPQLQLGDLEPGLVGARLGIHAGARYGMAIAELRGRSGVNLVNTTEYLDLAAESWKIGFETDTFHLRFGQIPRHIGPAEHGSLLWSHHAQAPPGGDIGGEVTLPKSLGIISTELAMGWLGAPRQDVNSPGWLLMEFHWSPHPVLELGFGRTSIFGGWENGNLRPIDAGQLILPTKPHVEDDPLQLLPDTDETAAWDISLAFPLRDWLRLPIDEFRLYIQHGGEDVIAQKLGPIPYPTLAGTANLYGLHLQLSKLSLTTEFAMLEDDLFRWYTGHRIYHDGWTQNDESIGHPWGGDQRDLILSAGWLEAGRWSMQIAAELVRRVEVADRIESTVYILPGIERRRYLHSVGTVWLAKGDLIQLEGSLGFIQNPDFALNETKIEHRVGINYTGRLFQWHQPRLIHQD